MGGFDLYFVFIKKKIINNKLKIKTHFNLPNIYV